MDQANQRNYSASVADVSLKPKRGRPKKHHRQNPGPSACAPPGFEKRKLKKARQVEADKKACEVMVGQAVSGIVDAAFDGGYLLSVRVGNSDYSLRGVVFKPGHYVPVSGENDVVPNVQMINRSEISLHSENQIQLNSWMPRSKRKYRKRVTRQTSEYSSSLSKSQTADQASHLVTSEGMLPPVELLSRSVSLSNGILPVSDLASLKTNQDNHTHHQSRPINTQKEGGSNCELEAKPTDAPFQTLLGEVMKRAQSPPHMPETWMENGESSDKFVEDSGIGLEAQDYYANEPLSVEPLQAVQPVHDHSAFLDNPLEYGRKGKLTELLQAMQENMIPNHSPRDH